MDHMEEPESVLEEMARVITDDGKLVVIEFNALGFDVINQVHLAVHKSSHDRGNTSNDAIGEFCDSRFEQVQRHALPLNDVWVSSWIK